MLVVKFDEKYVHDSDTIIYAYYACAVFSGGFTSYLRNGWSVNLRAIENCIFSIRSIERNNRPTMSIFLLFLIMNAISFLCTDKIYFAVVFFFAFTAHL